jgi:hypothetical protein
MSVTCMRPRFGGKVRPDFYYEQVNSVIEMLRPTASQATIAAYLNKCGLRTPRGLLFDRQRLANYLRNTSI